MQIVNRDHINRNLFHFAMNGFLMSVGVAAIVSLKLPIVAAGALGALINTTKWITTHKTEKAAPLQKRVKSLAKTAITTALFSLLMLGGSGGSALIAMQVTKLATTNILIVAIKTTYDPIYV